MPRDPERRREQQRELMRRRRAAKTGETETHPDSDGTSGGVFRPHRDEAGRMILEPGNGVDYNGEHYWGSVSRAPEGTRRCIAFEFGGRMIGGCQMLVQWEGRPLSPRPDGAPDLGQTIADSPYAREIQQRMPVTKGREPR